MKKFYQTEKSFRQSYVDTLGKLYKYATSTYAKLTYTKTIGSEQGYTYAEFKEATDSISKKLTQYGIGAGDKVAVLSENMPNWSVAFFAAVTFGRISIPICSNYIYIWYDRKR